MKFLLILSILFFCFTIGNLNKKSLKNSIFIGLALIFTSTIFSINIDIPTIILFIVSLAFLIILEFTKNTKFKKVFFLFSLIFFSFIILYLSGIINSKLQIDYQKLFPIDNSSLETIKRFQTNALYIPNILRPIVYNISQIIFALVIRTLDFLWINKLVTYLGFAFFYLFFLAIKKKANLLYLVFPIVIVLFGVLHRDPNNNLIYLFSVPPVIVFLTKNINKIKFSFLIVLILINCLYSFL